MAPRKTAPKKAARPQWQQKGLKLVGLRLEPWQDAALTAAADARKADGKPDADKSAVAREAIAAHPEVKRHRR